MLEDKTDRVTVSVGTKGSGKTHLLLQFIRYALHSKRYAEYHLILPSVRDEKDDAYSWLIHIPYVHIYDKYSPAVIERVTAAAEKHSKSSKSIFFAFDDATHSGWDISSDPAFAELITTSRHRRVSIWVVTHALTNVIRPMFRANIDRLFLFSVTNNKLLKSAWEEFFSMYKDYRKWDTFNDWFNEKVFSTKFGAIMLDLYAKTYTDTVPSWWLHKVPTYRYTPPPKPKPKPKRD